MNIHEFLRIQVSHFVNVKPMTAKRSCSFNDVTSVVDVEDDPFGEERDVHVRTDVWVTTEYDILPEILGR